MGMGNFAEPVHPGVCQGRNGERVALQEVELHATLHDLLCEVRTVQVYRNAEDRAIEVVYTFPLPLDAVLLDVYVTLGARELSGVVVEKASAERRYEAAVAEGDGAVMLEQGEAGLYTMNVGNLLPGETARIAIRYALLHRWSGERLRLHFPTTIAPRYGAMPLQPHQQPEHSLLVEHHFAFWLTVTGALREGQFTCPSHALVQSRTDDALVLSLRQERVAMDRDVVVELRASHVDRSALLMGVDGEGTAAIASFQPRLGGLRQAAPLSLVIVVDCSGSMEGDSIAQASRALREVVSQLQPHDQVGIIAFGSHTRRMRDRMAPCTPKLLEHAAAFCLALRADMGGTEVAVALDEAHRLLGSTERGEVFLITDGQVGGWEEVVQSARRSGHRHFTVGVGSAVTEAFVRRLAEETGGASELVSPNEQMAHRIVRHFERMRAPRAKEVRVTWPAGAMDVAPASFGTVFEGDTLVATARFASPPGDGEVALEVTDEAGVVTRQLLRLTGGGVSGAMGAGDAGEHALSTVARIAASRRLAAMTGEMPQERLAATQLALRYRLASPYTNWLVIAERAADEKADGMPALRKVPQTLAAGWGGVGSVHDAAPMRMYAMAPAPSPSMVERVRSASKKLFRASEVDTGTGSPIAALTALIEANPKRLSPEQVESLLCEFVVAAVGDDALDALFRVTDALGAMRPEAATIALAELLRYVGLGELSADAQLAVDAFRSLARGARYEQLRTPAVMEEVERVCRAVAVAGKRG